MTRLLVWLFGLLVPASLTWLEMRLVWRDVYGEAIA